MGIPNLEVVGYRRLMPNTGPFAEKKSYQRPEKTKKFPEASVKGLGCVTLHVKGLSFQHLGYVCQSVKTKRKLVVAKRIMHAS